MTPGPRRPQPDDRPPIDDPLEVLALHQPDTAGMCARCTAMGVGSNGEPVAWRCGPYLYARDAAVQRGLPLPDGPQQTDEPTDLGRETT